MPNHNRLRLDNGTLWPSAQAAAEVAYRARYGDPPDYHSAAVAEAYLHLLTHPAGVEAAIASLRSLRRAHRLNTKPTGNT